MSERAHNIRGIHYEISKPKKSPYDGHYHQRVRQVDERGNLVGIGEQKHRSARQNSEDGLVKPSIDLASTGEAAIHTLRALWGIFRRNPIDIVSGGAGLAHDLYSGLNEGYKTWPGTDSPWERPFDWQTGSSPVDFVHGPARGGIGDGKGIGRWWDASANFPPARSTRYGWESTGQGFENVPVPNLSPPPSPAWNDVFVRDSAAAAGVPSRNNIFEYGFPEPGSVLPPLTTPGAMRGAGFVGEAVALPISFIPATLQNVPGGLPGLMTEAGLNDPRNPDAPPPGGLVGLIQEYLRNSSRGTN